jgi:hypothetical protein
MGGHRSNFAYWVGVVMAIACFVIVVLDSTLLHSRMEIAGVSVASITGGAVIFSILIHELLDSIAEAPRKKKPRQRESEIHTAESQAGESPDNQQAVSTSEARDRVTTGTGR